MRNTPFAGVLTSQVCGVGLIALAVIVGSQIGLAAPVWCSPFETESNQVVSQDQIAGPVDNVVGEPGQSTGGVTNLDPLLYVQHGQFSPLIPMDIDPAGQAGSFAISTPDDRRTGLNTNLRSDAGDLANHLTFEGYFLMPDATPVISPGFIGRRLVTQKRSADDANSRLAVGVHATRVGVVDGLFDYEGFDYTGTVLDGQEGGVGFSGPWTNATTFAHLSDDGVSLDSDIFPFTVIGSRISGTGGTSARPLARPLDLSAEGEVTYLSALMMKTSTAAPSGDNLEIGLATSATSSGTSSTIRIGMTSGDAFFLTASNNPAGAVAAGTPYFVLVKIVSHASTPDECFMNVYAPGETVPTGEPETWLLTHSLSSSSTLTHLRLTIGASLVKGEVDEIRIGSTYESVTDPGAPVGDPGEVHNVLAAYWAEPTTEPPDPLVVNSYMALGTTPIEANAWHHFALTYDGTDIRWYLDGIQQGEILGPNVFPVGTAKIVVANNRSSGATSDRGFFGLLDEIRIWDRVLAPGEMLNNGGLPGPRLLWRSRFETQFGQAVTSGQAADTTNCIDNAVGAPDGTPAGIVASIYTAYGQPGVPAVPQEIDPGGLATGFALSMPDVSSSAVNTNIPSNARDFANAITAQGYFNTFRDTVITASAVGNRLVSTMRSSSEGQARLGIGLSPNDDPVPTHNVLSVAYYSTVDAAVLIGYGTTPIQPNTWYHFAMVYDGTDIRWYLNGLLEGEILSPPLIAPGSANMAIGNDRTLGNGTRGFYGLLDKIVISDHVIAPTEFMKDGFDPCLGVWCNVPFADFDYDDDVDMMDFAALQRCISTGEATLSEGCECFDRDGNNEVDMDDVSAFVACGTGANVPWSLEATPDCEP